MKKFALGLVWLIVMFTSVLALRAQTPTPPDLLEGSQRFDITGNFAASSGNAINNGAQATMEFRFSNHVYGRIDQFGLSNPTATTLTFAKIEGKWSLAHIIKPSTYFDTNPILLAIHGGPGIVKSPNGAVSLAGGLGISVDYNVPGMAGFYLRPIDVTVAYSRGLDNHLQVLGTWTSVQTGLGFRF